MRKLRKRKNFSDSCVHFLSRFERRMNPFIFVLQGTGGKKKRKENIFSLPFLGFVVIPKGKLKT